MRKLQLLILSGLLTLPASVFSSDQSHDAAYARAVADAAVIEPDEMVTLPVIDTPRVSVVTWTNYPDSYRPGESVTLSWGEVWVTLDGAVQQRCRDMSQDSLIADLQKLLGLPLADGSGRRFVTLEVESKDLFRPCANPSLTQTRCGTGFPSWLGERHRAWFAGQTATAYQTPDGFPWTRLGYTYNWKQGESEVGPAEFVIVQGARVKTLAVSDSAGYCRP